MSGVDAYTTSYMGTLHARMKAYDEVLTTHGKIDNKLLKLAEEKHYKSMFNSQGMLTDAAVKNATGEIALNLDSAAAKVFTDATTAVPAVKPILMFPRSGTNAVRLALSYTPLVGITPLDKYGKTIWAVTDDQIDKALKAHGLSLQTPNARNIFENLKTEYIGRQVFSTVLVNRLWAFAMDGNIRGRLTALVPDLGNINIGLTAGTAVVASVNTFAAALSKLRAISPVAFLTAASVSIP
jgi:hypothetical protein